MVKSSRSWVDLWQIPIQTLCVLILYQSKNPLARFSELKENVKKVVTTTLCCLPFYRETPAYYGQLYKKHNITRAHVIKLGPNNDAAAKEALASWPGETIIFNCDRSLKLATKQFWRPMQNLGGLQVGGGISVENAQEWIDFGANKVGRSCLCTRIRQASC